MKMTKRAVLYARVSGDDRGSDGRNLAGQLDMCREHAERQIWRIVAELAEDDRGASSALFELPQHYAFGRWPARATLTFYSSGKSTA